MRKVNVGLAYFEFVTNDKCGRDPGAGMKMKNTLVIVEAAVCAMQGGAQALPSG